MILRITSFARRSRARSVRPAIARARSRSIAKRSRLHRTMPTPGTTSRSRFRKTATLARREIALAEAAKRDPHRPEVHNIRGTALAEAGDLADGGERVSRHDCRRSRGTARAYNNLGNVLRAMNRDTLRQRRRIGKSIELAPRYADPLQRTRRAAREPTGTLARRCRTSTRRCSSRPTSTKRSSIAPSRCR